MSFAFASRFPARRLRRLRRDEFSRRLVREHRLTTDDLIYPVFVLDGSRARGAGRVDARRRAHSRSTCCSARPRRCVTLGIPALALFPVIERELKTLDAEEAWQSGRPRAAQRARR